MEQDTFKGAGRAEPAENHTPTTIHILVIENDEDDLILAVRCLESCEHMSFRISSVSTLADASRAIHHASHPFDLIMLDLGLPDSLGLETLESILNISQESPILVMTGDSRPETGIQAVRAGAQGYLCKSELGKESMIREISHTMERALLIQQLSEQNRRLKISEALLLQHQQQLEDEVESRTEDLNIALRKLQAQHQEKKDFVANATHELKTPLTSITFAIENLHDPSICGNLSEKQTEYIELIEQDTDRLRRHVEDILDLSRIDASAIELDRTLINLARLCREVVSGLHLISEEKNIAICTELDPRHGFIYADRHKIGRSLTNIVQNALKFSAPGGEVRITSRSSTEDASIAQVIVSDSGPGISPEDLPRVTRRYFRSAERVEGTGLGLAITKEILELHGGSLSIISPPENQSRGTAVTLSIPVHPAPRIHIHLNGNHDDHWQNVLNNHGFDTTLRKADSDLSEIDIKSALLMLPLDSSTTSGLDMFSSLDPECTKRGNPRVLVVLNGIPNEGLKQVLQAYGAHVFDQEKGIDTLVHDLDRLVTRMKPTG